MRLLSVLIIAGLLVEFGCSSPSGGDDDDDGGDNPVTYELTASASPSEGGSVSPESGTYDEGEQVEVTATAADGWVFTGWSGDIGSSDDNPLSFTIDQDTDLTASFVEESESYSNQIEISDGTYSELLTFGMESGASDGFDSGLDDEAPPEPPEDSFFANFVIEGYNLYADYRPVQNQQTIWEVHFGASSSSSITLSWSFSSSEYHGTLTLVDDPNNASVEVNMGSQSSYNVSDNSVETLYIVHE